MLVVSKSFSFLVKNTLLNRSLVMNRTIIQYLVSSSNRKSTTSRKQIIQLKKPSQIFNVPPKILQLYQKKLLHVENHPLYILKNMIIKALGSDFLVKDNISPIVSVQNNFNNLNFPEDHCTRSPSDTYYINDSTLLRTHTSAHQVQSFLNGERSFVVFGDVYRRDQIDRFHYPAFHQMEAVRILGKKGEISVEDAVKDLKATVERIIEKLFGKVQMRWIDAFFPFTEPSFEVQIFYEGKWVEMLGSGVIHDFVMKKGQLQDQVGWAAGLGLERFAMKLFKIPDVRLFWSEDQRFIQQFKQGQISQFKPFSKYPICTKDFSMWIKPGYNPNDLFETIRQIGGDLVQTVEQVDNFYNAKTGKTSKTYRIGFRSLQRTLTNEQITKIQFLIRDSIATMKNIELR